MDESGNHHSQQTDTITENQTPHVLTHRQVLNNENTWTQGGEPHTLESVGGNRGGRAVGREVGEGQHGKKCQMWVMAIWFAASIPMYVPMQQFCMFYTCTPEPKVQ